MNQVDLLELSAKAVSAFVGVFALKMQELPDEHAMRPAIQHLINTFSTLSWFLANQAREAQSAGNSRVALPAAARKADPPFHSRR